MACLFSESGFEKQLDKNEPESLVSIKSTVAVESLFSDKEGIFQQLINWSKE